MVPNLTKFIRNYQQNNPYIIKEVVTILSTLLAFLDRELQEDHKVKQQNKIETFKKKELGSELEAFKMVPVILGEYLGMIKEGKITLNTSVVEIFLIFTKQLLDNQILLPKDVADINVFQILSSSVTVIGQNQL